ncbi:ABC transporter ATP-binding protein [Pandoraea terrae]|uniref:ABC transporter ATP-binding protein n=1 Tax=Pandoraea terrae TaxID=1537710 RepID=A0A5E4W749_9BURK|nr:ABC transporter ATP-binding protein [Pandoraea terrae]VVE20241.1 ABC transporter ATP-binding protein [Pandoraea terrae]
MGVVKPILEIRSLTKRFGGLTAVDEVSFTLAQGEILGLIGPNGAGKTTVVSLINGTVTPSEGGITFDGHLITGLSSFRRARLGIGRTFQITKPFPGLSVLDNVAVGALFGASGGATTLPRAREHALHSLEFVGLAHRAGQRADELGGPDRKRLELAKAMAMRPRLLLLDEVMAGLNSVEIEEVIAVVKKVRDSGVSILVIEHVIKAIRRLSDRLLVLHHGQKIADGPVDDILADARVVDAYLGRRRT